MFVLTIFLFYGIDNQAIGHKVQKTFKKFQINATLLDLFHLPLMLLPKTTSCSY